jgi:predicted RNase H-like nuclease
MTSFIGIDMAWRIDGNHSGIAVMEGDTAQVRLATVSADVISMAAVVDFVSAHSPPDAVAAIDASLIVKNTTGQRPCEKSLSVRFGKYDASCHTSNLGCPHATTGMKLVKELEKSGFSHNFDLAEAKQRSGKWIVEVYPHPAMVQLFRLDNIIKYKKGTPIQRRAGLEVLRQRLKDLADGSRGLVGSPTLTEVLDRDLAELRGRGLKRYEDTLDAIFCAYLAWHCWRWGEERNEMFGTMVEGYIVVPKGIRTIS